MKAIESAPLIGFGKIFGGEKMKTYLLSYWKVILVVNLLLGVFLWFIDSTDYSLKGTISDFVFPPLVFIIALLTLLAVTDIRKKRSSKLICLPSLIGGGIHILVGILMVLPPFTLALLFGIDEINNEVRIQQVSSPDNSQTAEVYFRPVGAYSGGSGRIYVKVSNKLLPFIERDLLYLRVSHADENTKNYLKWIDNDTLYVPEIKEYISVGTVELETPYAIAVPINIVLFLIMIATH